MESFDTTNHKAQPTLQLELWLTSLACNGKRCDLHSSTDNIPCAMYCAVQQPTQKINSVYRIQIIWATANPQQLRMSQVHEFERKVCTAYLTGQDSVCGYICSMDTKWYSVWILYPPSIIYIIPVNTCHVITWWYATKTPKNGNP